jgi:hypothetical protein
MREIGPPPSCTSPTGALMMASLKAAAAGTFTEF